MVLRAIIPITTIHRVARGADAAGAHLGAVARVIVSARGSFGECVLTAVKMFSERIYGSNESLDSGA